MPSTRWTLAEYTHTHTHKEGEICVSYIDVYSNVAAQSSTSSRESPIALQSAHAFTTDDRRRRRRGPFHSSCCRASLAWNGKMETSDWTWLWPVCQVAGNAVLISSSSGSGGDCGSGSKSHAYRILVVQRFIKVNIDF